MTEPTRAFFTRLSEQHQPMLETLTGMVRFDIADGERTDTRLGSILTTIHWLPNRLAASYTNCGCFTAAELIETLSQPASSNWRISSERADSAAHGERHEHFVGGPPHHVEHNVPLFVARRDVEEHQLVGPLLLVPRGDLHRVTGVAQVDEIGPFHHASAVDVQTRNHTLGKHHATPVGAGIGKNAPNYLV